MTSAKIATQMRSEALSLRLVTEADTMRHKFKVGQLMDFAHPDRA